MDSNNIELYSGSYDYRISKDNIYHPLRYGKHFLYQIGRMHCNKHTHIPMHIQLNYIELTVATDGKARVVTNGDSINIEAGDIYLSFPGDFHEIIVDEICPLKYDYITIMTEDEVLFKEIDGVIASCHEADARVTRDDYIRRLVARAINEINVSDQFTDTVMESLINQMLVSIIRDYKSHAPDDSLKNVTDAELFGQRCQIVLVKELYRQAAGLALGGDRDLPSQHLGQSKLQLFIIGVLRFEDRFFRLFFRLLRQLFGLTDAHALFDRQL